MPRQARHSGEGGQNGTDTGQPAVLVPDNLHRMARNGALHLLGYTPPQLHTGKVWYLSYYVLHPETRLPIRKRVKLNRAGGPTARRQYAQQVAAELLTRLQAGWRPHIDEGAPKGHYTLAQAVAAYLRAKVEDLRHSSPDAYNSHARILTTWAGQHQLLDKYVSAFTRTHALAFMQYAREERQVCARTWNNYRDMQAGMWKWLIEQGYASTNPFAAIKARKEGPKVRRYLTVPEREQMTRWCMQHDPAFYTACLFVFHTLIRPRELARLRVEYIDLHRQVIVLPRTITKNGEDGVASIPDVMLPYLTDMALEKCPGHYYVMGACFRPGPKPVSRNSYSRRWAKLRKALGWGNDLQLYSLRDTGIICLLQARMDVLAVRQQARHKSIETTNAYLKHAFPEGVEAIRKGARALSDPGPYRQPTT